MIPALVALALGNTAADTGGYWQQQVSYRITASLDESSGVLTGHVRIAYVNRSPDTLADFYVHQYLNAFRPGSRWSATDSAAGVERYQHMRDPDYAFERITQATIAGVTAAPDYPDAPDSTIAHWSLARPLAPGDSLVAEIDWRARPSTLPRRQGRRGRRFDFAQWYPKVVVYDRYGWEAHPLYPSGEFYGEFATYDVTLDLPQDEVIGATGVPVCGDPGWERASAVPGTAVAYQRDYYGAVPNDCPAAAAGRKTVRFRAEQVHHFAFSLNPEYRYEQGQYGRTVVHVLYLPGDTASWGRGVAVGETETALAWFDSLYGPFAWPQLTNVHRIEGGGTEFPMVIMDGGASQGLILHEGGHQYTMGILANNEWREGFLDEGFTSFQTSWYFATHGGGDRYPGLEAEVLDYDLQGWSQPVSLVSERYRDFPTYNLMIYGKGELFYDELRYVVGDDVMRRILRTYYARWKLKHVDEDKFRAVCEEVSHQDLGWLFAQWLHGTPRIDYRLERVERHALPGGQWQTTVTIRRLGDGFMPMEIGDEARIYARSTGQPEVERVTFTSDHKPGRLLLDPRGLSHDWNALNNEEQGLRWFFSRSRTHTATLDDPFAERAYRDREVQAWLPVAWSNDAAGVTLGLRERANYLGDYDRSLAVLSVGLGDSASQRFGIYARYANPLPSAPSRTSVALAGWSVEGRSGALLHVDQSLRSRLDQGSDPHAGFDVEWMATTDMRYVDRRLWSDAGTIEAGPWWSVTVPRGQAVWRANLSARGGLSYQNPIQLTSGQRIDVFEYARVTGAASVRRPFWLGTRLGVRLYAGGYFSGTAPTRQRRIYYSGADPYETFDNPLLRSRGALLLRPDLYYEAPGGGNLRGFGPALGGRWAVTTNIEDAKALLQRPTGLIRTVSVEAFADGGVVDTSGIGPSVARGRYTGLYDGGLGVVVSQVLRRLPWTTRVEFPFIVSRPGRARDAQGASKLAFRWQFSLGPSF